MSYDLAASCPVAPAALGAARRWRAAGARAALLGLLFHGAAGCGAAEDGGAPPPCELTGSCVVAPACQGSGCSDAAADVQGITEPGGCDLVFCPAGSADCCSTVVATATGNRAQSFAQRPDMVRRLQSSNGALRADFTFDAPNQQGWVTFQLSEEMDLSRLDVFGWGERAADRLLSLNTNALDQGGCARVFEPEPRPTPFGPVLGSTILFDPRPTEENLRDCYRGGTPGRASELAFAIFSTAPGNASLVISNISLRAD